MKTIIVPALLFIMLCGCIHNKPSTFDSTKKYKAVVEGYYNFPVQWIGKCPAVVLKKKDRVHLGESICLTDSGISLVKSRGGFLGTADTVYFQLDEVQAVIDSNSNCIYGTIPQKIIDRKNINTWIYLMDEKGETNGKYIEMFPNQPFACELEPGKYYVDRFIFRSTEEKLRSIYIPQLMINVEENKTNYLGNITIVFNNKDTSSYIKIPYTSRSETSYGGIGGTFGPIGISINPPPPDLSYPGTVCYLKVEEDSTFRFQSLLPPVSNLLQEVRGKNDAKSE